MKMKSNELKLVLHGDNDEYITRIFMYWSGSKEEELMSSRVAYLEEVMPVELEDMEGSGE